jgi:hypothetical protein
MPLFTELPRRRVFTETELPALSFLGNPVSGVYVFSETPKHTGASTSVPGDFRVSFV